MTDPYKTLGVKRNASDDAVKKAYRKLARRHHPDRGGDEATFKEVQEAYDLLSDAERRAHYDATGETSTPREVNEMQVMAAVLAPLLLGVMEEAAKNKIPVGELDLMTSLNQTVDHAVKDMDGMVETARKMRDDLLAVAERLSLEGAEDNVLAAVAMAHAGQMDGRAKVIALDAERFRKAKESLKKYRYRMDVVKVMFPSRYGASWTSTTGS